MSVVVVLCVCESRILTLPLVTSAAEKRPPRRKLLLLEQDWKIGNHTHERGQQHRQHGIKFSLKREKPTGRKLKDWHIFVWSIRDEFKFVIDDFCPSRIPGFQAADQEMFFNEEGARGAFFPSEALGKRLP